MRNALVMIPTVPLFAAGLYRACGAHFGWFFVLLGFIFLVAGAAVSLRRSKQG
jgi:hypothetical protein